MARQLISADRPSEKIVGYSRAVRVGNTVEVSGTAILVEIEATAILE